MSAYNGEKYLNQQLDSIFEREDIVLYVRDDGSKDNTVEYLKQYAIKHHVQIHVDEGKNVGSANSFLNALRNCPIIADYYAFCDQDDVWCYGKLSKAVEQIGDTNQPTLWCSNYQVTDSDLQVLVSSALKEPVQDSIKAIFYNNVPGCTMVFNWALMQEIRKINVTEIRMHDIMVINVALLTGKVVFNSTPYVLYRQHKNNVLGYNHKKIKIKKWIKEKIYLLRNKEPYSTAEYARAILTAFENQMSDQEKKEYFLISGMDKSLIRRIKILTKPYTRERIGRTSISIRCKILLNLM